MKYLFYYLIVFTSILLLFQACVPIQPTGSQSIAATYTYPELSFENRSYNDRIKTVQLVHLNASKLISTNNPIIELGKSERLLLTFDDINETQQQYSAKIIHCDKDWTTESNIQPMDYLDEYNQFPIRDYEFSFDTKLGYMHYEWNVPKVKLSGNYLIVVFNSNNENDIILSERFMVHENKATIKHEITVPNVVSHRRTHQELEFEVFIYNINVLNSGTDIYPVVRQNSNWLYAIDAPKPQKITDGNKRLTYKFYNGELDFSGTNEFRFFDISMVNFKGSGVLTINKETTPFSATLKTVGVRASEPYREWKDRNGAFVIGNSERQNTPLASDYIMTDFKLQAAEEYQDIYIVGEFNNWELSNASKMRYNPQTALYENTFLLKQGYYEYSYYVADHEPNPIEGSHYEAENDYDILIYYKSNQLRYDRLIGYAQLNSRNSQ